MCGGPNENIMKYNENMFRDKETYIEGWRWKSTIPDYIFSAKNLTDFILFLLMVMFKHLKKKANCFRIIFLVSYLYNPQNWEFY